MASDWNPGWNAPAMTVPMNQSMLAATEVYQATACAWATTWLPPKSSSTEPKKETIMLAERQRANRVNFKGAVVLIASDPSTQ